MTNSRKYASHAQPLKKTAQLRYFFELFQPALDAIKDMPVLQARGNRKLQMTSKDRLRALVFLDLEEHTSAQHLLQRLKEDDFE